MEPGLPTAPTSQSCPDRELAPLFVACVIQRRERGGGGQDSHHKTSKGDKPQLLRTTLRAPQTDWTVSRSKRCSHGGKHSSESRCIAGIFWPLACSSG